MHKRRWALAFTLSLTSATAGQAQPTSGGAEDAYRAAQKSYYALKKDAARRRRRDAWQMVAKKFETVANKYPESPRAPDSLFTAAQLFEDLSRISFVAEDLEASARDYRRLLDQHPRHHLVDDGALALAKLLLERQNDPDGARKTLTRTLHDFPKGDRTRELKALLASLPPESKKSAVASVTRKPSSKAESASVSTAARKPATVAAVEDDSDTSDANAGGKLKSHEPAAEPEVEVELPTTRSLVAEAAPAEPISREPIAALKDKEKDRELAQAPVSKSMKERLKALSKKTKVELSLAEQLGLKVRRVVIDAGHGGHDAGAVGVGGTKEKDVSLAIAKRLATVLEANGLDVVLTRDDDHFVRLEDRAKIANEARGDLFISIHCNSAQSHTLHGVETYTLNLASDRYSIRLAARENSTTAKRMSDLQFILADLATKANTDESTQLASRVQHNVVSRLGAKYANVRDLGNKEALFYVLLGAKMPSILVETSFISNPEEEKRLESKMYQDDVARSIAAGVEEFLGARERVAKVD